MHLITQSVHRIMMDQQFIKQNLFRTIKSEAKPVNKILMSLLASKVWFGPSMTLIDLFFIYFKL